MRGAGAAGLRSWRRGRLECDMVSAIPVRMGPKLTTFVLKQSAPSQRRFARGSRGMREIGHRWGAAQRSRDHSPGDVRAQDIITRFRNVLRHPHGRTRCTRARGRVVAGVRARLFPRRREKLRSTPSGANSTTRGAPSKLRSCAARARRSCMSDDVSSQYCTAWRGSTHLRHHADVVRAPHSSRRRPSTIIPTALCISLASWTRSPHLRGAQIW